MPTKEEFMTTCLKDHTQAECDQMWEDKQETQTQDYASLARAYEDLKINYNKLVAQNKQMIDIATRYNDNLKAADDAKKAELEKTIFFDAKGQFTKEQLITKSLEELQAIRTGMDAVTDKAFASVIAEADAQNQIRKPKLTVGEWDAEHKQWKGGM